MELVPFCMLIIQREMLYEKILSRKIVYVIPFAHVLCGRWYHTRCCEIQGKILYDLGRQPLLKQFVKSTL
jgi:hypothetical protein